jgi:hypothetical protein
MVRLAVLASLCLALAGCAAPAKQSASEDTKAENQPRLKKLLSSTDRLVIKHFFPASSVTIPGLSRFFGGGFCAMGPVIAFEPGKEGERLKGVRIGVTSVYEIQNQFSRPEEGSSFLDLDEARDLDSAMSYMAQTAEGWKSKPPSDDIEVTFTSKDDFTAALLPNRGETTLLFQSGRIGKASVSLPASLLQEAQTQLHHAIQTLDAN